MLTSLSKVYNKGKQINHFHNFHNQMNVGKSNFEYLKMLQCFMSQILIKFSQPEYNIISYHIML